MTNPADYECSVIEIRAPSRPGLLTAVTGTLQDLGLDVRSNIWSGVAAFPIFRS